MPRYYAPNGSSLSAMIDLACARGHLDHGCIVVWHAFDPDFRPETAAHFERLRVPPLGCRYSLKCHDCTSTATTFLGLPVPHRGRVRRLPLGDVPVVAGPAGRPSMSDYDPPWATPEALAAALARLPPRQMAAPDGGAELRIHAALSPVATGRRVRRR
jgi:hypothetical protein